MAALWNFITRLFTRQKKKEGQLSKVVPDHTGLYEQSVAVRNKRLADLDIRRSVLDWRDSHVEKAELHLNRELATLLEAVDRQLEKMTISDIFIRKRKFGKDSIEPIYLEWAEKEAKHIVDDAQEELRNIFAHAIHYEHSRGRLKEVESGQHYADAAIAAAATGAGLAAIPAFAGWSVVSAGGILGWVGITTISVPIVAVGIAVVGSLLALGGYKLTDLKSKAVSRYRAKIHEFISEQAIGNSGRGASLRTNLQNLIRHAAETILKEIDA